MEKKTKTKDPSLHKPFRLLAIAPSQYGKTQAICQFVLKKIKDGMFRPQSVIIISPTCMSDQSIRPLIDLCISKTKKKNYDFEKENIFLGITDEAEQLLEQILETNHQIKDNGKTPHHYLILMDDVVSESALAKKRTVLQKVATMGRHYNMSTVLSLQAYRGTMNTTVRSQFSIIMIGRLLSIGEVEDLAEQYNQGLGSNSKDAKKEFQKLWEKAIQRNNGHGFLVVHTYQQFGQGRIQIGGLDQPFHDN